MLHAGGLGFVKRTYPLSARISKDAAYRLGKADGSSLFVLVSKAMSDAELDAFKSAVVRHPPSSEVTHLGLTAAR